MKTAVEWLIDKHFGGIDNVTPDFKHHIKQAKEMEKEQIKKAFHKNSQKWFCQLEAEQYYNETFKSE